MTEKQIAILKIVSSQVGLPYEVVHRIWRSQWETLRDHIRAGDRLDPERFPEVFVRGCGRFKPVDGLIDKINKAQDGRLERKGSGDSRWLEESSGNGRGGRGDSSEES